MSARTNKDQDLGEAAAYPMPLHFSELQIMQGTKFNLSLERRIENVWFRAQQIGWSYNDFVIRLMEVLIILHHRNKIAKTNGSPQ